MYLLHVLIRHGHGVSARAATSRVAVAESGDEVEDDGCIGRVA